MLKIKIIISLIILSIFGYFIKDYYSMKSNIKILTKNNEKLKLSVSKQSLIINSQNKNLLDWKKSRENYIKKIQELSDKNSEYQSDINNLRGLFERHDLQNLSIRKPILIENRINRSSDNIIRMLECETDRNKKCTD